MKCNSLSFKRPCTQMTMINYTNITSGTGDFVKRCLLRLFFLIRAVENCHLGTDPAGLIVPYRFPDIWTWIRVCSKRCQLRSLTSLRINSDTRSDVESKIYTLQLFNLYLSFLYIANYEQYNTKFFKKIFFFF